MTSKTNHRSAKRNIVTLISGTLSAQVITLAITPVLSRLYGPAPFGEYALFVSITTLIAIVGTLRYEMAVVLPRSPREAAAVARMGIRILGLVSLLTAIVGLGLALLLFREFNDLTWFVLLTGPGVFLIGYTSFMTQWLIRTGKYPHISRNKIAQSAVTAIAQTSLGLAVPTGVGLAIGLIIGQLAGALLLALMSRREKRLLVNIDTRRWQYLLRKHWRLPALLMPHTLVDSFRLNGVNLLIGFYSVGALGQYSQAWRFVQLPAGLVGSAVSQVYFPQLASAARHELFHLVRSSVLRSFALGAAPFALIFLLSPTIFPIILGQQWQQAGLYAQALTPALYVNLAASPISTIFVVLHKEHIGLLFAATYTCVSLGALVIFASDLLLAVWMMSAAQAVALIAYVALTLWLVRPQPSPTHPERDAS